MRFGETNSIFHKSMMQGSMLVLHFKINKLMKAME